MSKHIRVDPEVMVALRQRQAHLQMWRMRTVTMNDVARDILGLPAMDSEFGPHVPGCDGNCATRPGSEQCFA